MKATEKKSGLGGLMLTAMLFLIAFSAQATTLNKFISDVKKEMSRDGMTGVYLIAGILGFGIVLFIIVSIVNKFKKPEPKPTNIKHIAHRHHHHPHRVIKKSA
jgi:hypothetical protein